MKEHPILMSAPMVRAILEGSKTQTRRVMNPQPVHAQFHCHKGKEVYDGEERRWCWKGHVGADNWESITIQLAEYAPYKVGDLLWVKESAYIAPKGFGDRDLCNRIDKQGEPRMVGYAERGRNSYAEDYGIKLTPSIFLPRWASRITLEVTGIRIERLQDISEDDAMSEGCLRLRATGRITDVKGGQYFGRTWNSARDWYTELWESINGKKHPWESNPWVWVYSFRRAA